MSDTTVVLVSCDGVHIVLPRRCAVRNSVLLRDLLDDEPTSSESEIPIPGIRGEVLTIVVEHMKYRTDTPAKELERPLRQPLVELLDEHDKKLISNWDPHLTIELVKAANFLNDCSLRDLASARLAQYLIEKNVDEIRAMLGLERDFTDEEEALLRKEHQME